MFFYRNYGINSGEIAKTFGYSKEEFFNLPYFAQRSVLVKYLKEERKSIIRSKLKKQSPTKINSKIKLENNLGEIFEREEKKKIKIKSLLKR